MLSSIELNVVLFVKLLCRFVDAFLTTFYFGISHCEYVCSSFMHDCMTLLTIFNRGSSVIVTKFSVNDCSVNCFS